MFAPAAMPGSAVPASAPGNFGIADPGINFVTGLPSQNAAWAQGGVPPREHSHMMFSSNTFIQHHYLTANWRDNSHNELMEGMLVFTAADVKPEDGVTTIVSLPKLNNLLRNAYDEFQEMAREVGSEAAEFQDLLYTYGEDALSQYIHSVNNRTVDTDYKGIDADDAKYLARMYALHARPVFCYQTKIGLLNLWNPTGAVINTDRGTSMEADFDPYNANNVAVSNLNLAKVARVGNVFGPSHKLVGGVRLYHVLRRAPLRDGGFGHFQVVPMYVDGGNYVPINAHQYMDPSGRWVSGHTWYIGTVLSSPENSVTPAAIERATGLGLGATPRLAYEAHGAIPMMRVSIGC
jgi:hypothetical protein